VFLLQAVILRIVALAPQLAQLAPRPEHLTWLDGLGVLIFTVGLGFEAVGDFQMLRFRQDPANSGKVMDQGLWAYTRHPNYFGESLVWWGIFCIALATPYWWAAWVSPVLITVLLLKVSGVTMAEQDIDQRRPAYAIYKRKVNAFIPGLPSRW
jgi:steroid 5-alpha reductase family enzyme